MSPATIAFLFGLLSWFKTVDANRELQDFWYLLSLVGFAIAIVLHRVKVRQDRKSAINDKYSILQGRWIRLLELNLQYPNLDFGSQRVLSETDLSKVEQYQQYQLFGIVVSILEEVWLLRDLIPSSHWTGWDQYMTDYCNSPVFRKLWFHALGPETEEKSPASQYDKTFDEFMLSKFNKELSPGG
jgi:hypothetical protein